MTPLAKLLLQTADRLPLPPMKSYAGVVKVLHRASMTVDRLEKENQTLRDNQNVVNNNNVVHIQHKGKCT